MGHPGLTGVIKTLPLNVQHLEVLAAACDKLSGRGPVNLWYGQPPGELQPRHRWTCTRRSFTRTHLHVYTCMYVCMTGRLFGEQEEAVRRPPGT